MLVRLFDDIVEMAGLIWTNFGTFQHCLVFRL